MAGQLRRAVAALAGLAAGRLDHPVATAAHAVAVVDARAARGQQPSPLAAGRDHGVVDTPGVALGGAALRACGAGSPWPGRRWGSCRRRSRSPRPRRCRSGAGSRCRCWRCRPAGSSRRRGRRRSGCRRPRSGRCTWPPRPRAAGAGSPSRDRWWDSSTGGRRSRPSRPSRCRSGASSRCRWWRCRPVGQQPSPPWQAVWVPSSTQRAWQVPPLTSLRRLQPIQGQLPGAGTERIAGLAAGLLAHAVATGALAVGVVGGGAAARTAAVARAAGGLAGRPPGSGRCRPRPSPPACAGCSPAAGSSVGQRPIGIAGLAFLDGAVVAGGLAVAVVAGLAARRAAAVAVDAGSLQPVVHALGLAGAGVDQAAQLAAVGRAGARAATQRIALLAAGALEHAVAAGAVAVLVVGGGAAGRTAAVAGDTGGLLVVVHAAGGAGRGRALELLPGAADGRAARSGSARWVAGLALLDGAVAATSARRPVAPVRARGGGPTHRRRRRDRDAAPRSRSSGGRESTPPAVRRMPGVLSSRSPRHHRSLYRGAIRKGSARLDCRETLPAIGATRLAQAARRASFRTRWRSTSSHGTPTSLAVTGLPIAEDMAGKSEARGVAHPSATPTPASSYRDPHPGSDRQS